MQDNRSVQQNVLNEDNRSVSVEQKILNLFRSGGGSSSSGGGGGEGGGGGSGGGGGPGRRRQLSIGDEPKQEKRAALAIEDKPKKQKPSQPDVPIALPDRSRQAKRKPEIPKEAPDEEAVKKLGKTLVRALRNKSKIRIQQPTKVVDVGPATPFKGKGRRLGDEERARVITTQFDKKAAAADSSKRRTARNNQLAITA